jgi:FtsP/CotA-like multicopper oxidase with cupredoxin domain
MAQGEQGEQGDIRVEGSADDRGDEQGYGLATVIFTFLAVLLALCALGVAGAAMSKSNDAEDAATKANGTPVTLTEFAIDPSMLDIAPGGTLTVRNGGSAVHNLEVEGEDLKTPDLQAGGTASLDLSSLDAGNYTVFCNIPGHRAAGMEAMLMLGTMGGGSGDGKGTAAAGGVNTPQNDRADLQQKAPVDAFVDQLTKGANTEGVGAQVMAPKVLPDGTKQFDLTAEVVDWEVEPGKTVQAWAYNGTVPGPTIKVQPGDRVRIVLDNQLPQSTAIHLHGITTPNAMDGVPYVTQDPVKPGETFTYEFVAREPAVGMYHSHHHAEHQVPDGLIGAFLIGDQPVPAGVTVSQEVPMVLNDAGVIGLTLNGKSFPATAPVIAKQGEWVEIHYMNEGLQIHPMHLHGMPQLVIAKDGFAIAPYQADTISVAPGERYTVLVHATEPGVWAWHCHILNHAEREDGMFGMVTTFIVQ